MQKSKILVSACLVGIPCRYNGTSALNDSIQKLLNDSELVIVCPELLGGEVTPRPACNIHEGSGNDVLEGTARIIGIDGKDYTESYVLGAKKTLEIAISNNISKAILKKHSPSCGVDEIYNSEGTDIINGDGVLAALLKNNNIEVISL